MESPPHRILVVDDEANMRHVLAAMLRRQGHDVIQAASAEQALVQLADEDVSVVVSDLRMPGMDGLELLGRVVRDHPSIPFIMLTAHGTVETAVEAMKRGAFDYITKPFERDEMERVVALAVRHRELARLSASADVIEDGRVRMIGQSRAIMEIHRLIDKIARSPSTVLISGESGTGKELVARAIHESSDRADGPIIRLNCAAIPQTLLESELFGYERGAFTGAVTSKPGRFELAHKGTLFLDEVGEIPRDMQVKLLRVLQEQEFERVGGVRTIQVDVRVLAATNKDLQAEVAAGNFRQDLYYRFNIIRLHLPPLRERPEDIPLLAAHFLRKLNAKLGRQIGGFTPRAQQALLAYAWPGNIRELENAIERALLLAEGELADLQDLPDELRATGRPAAAAAEPAVPRLKDAVRKETAEVEIRWISRALRRTGGNVSQAARDLGISRKSLQKKMKEYGLRESENH